MPRVTHPFRPGVTLPRAVTELVVERRIVSGREQEYAGPEHGHQGREEVGMEDDQVDPGRILGKPRRMVRLLHLLILQRVLR